MSRVSMDDRLGVVWCRRWAIGRCRGYMVGRGWRWVIWKRRGVMVRGRSWMVRSRSWMVRCWCSSYLNWSCRRGMRHVNLVPMAVSGASNGDLDMAASEGAAEGDNTEKKSLHVVS